MTDSALARIAFSDSPACRTAGRAPSPPPAAAETRGDSFLGFLKGVADILNPLQHIPVVGALYRHWTGDDISPLARVAGGALYGGPVGFAVSAADVACQEATGKDAGEILLAGVSAPPSVQMADIADRYARTARLRV